MVITIKVHLFKPSSTVNFNKLLSMIISKPNNKHHCIIVPLLTQIVKLNFPETQTVFCGGWLFKVSRSGNRLPGGKLSKVIKGVFMNYNLTAGCCGKNGVALLQPLQVEGWIGTSPTSCDVFIPHCHLLTLLTPHGKTHQHTKMRMSCFKMKPNTGEVITKSSHHDVC